MKEIFQSPYKKYFLAALLLNSITAWFSVGSHHPDEHFQILEFANYKLGNAPAADMPWEFATKMRPAIQPFITYCFIKCLSFLNVSNPFTSVFLLRLVMGVLTWFVSCKLILLFISGFKTEKGKTMFILLSFFLWFMPYISVRYSSESTAALSFMAAVYFLLKPHTSNFQKNTSYLFVGVLLALSFFFRFQMAFAFMGLAIWLLVVQKINFKTAAIILLSFLFTCFVCVCVDKWFYSEWVFTPYNYYTENITKHAAANYGVEPWWYYFDLFFNMAAPPLSLVLLYFLGAGLYKNKTHVFSFVLLAFVIGHSLVAHKEMRFMYPVTFVFIYLVSAGIDFYVPKIIHRKFFKLSFVLLVVLNSVLLLYRTFSPAQEAMLYYRYVYTAFQKPTTIVSIGESMYLYAAKINFYRSQNINEVVLKDETDLTDYLHNNNLTEVVVFKKNGSSENTFPAGYESKRIYSVFPEWLLKYNTNNWQDRANIWCIYELRKK
ncbi:MAG: hypothetical protein KF900_09085 [Bacteroidetes bacterium]|nr:hypothetical protein [Bacteroidota bacterium]